MVLVRRLLFHSNLLHRHLTYRATPLSFPAASTRTSTAAASRRWQTRSFSALTRYNREKDDKSSDKEVVVENSDETRFPKVENSLAKTDAVNADGSAAEESISTEATEIPVKLDTDAIPSQEGVAPKQDVLHVDEVSNEEAITSSLELSDAAPEQDATIVDEHTRGYLSKEDIPIEATEKPVDLEAEAALARSAATHQQNVTSVNQPATSPPKPSTPVDDDDDDEGPAEEDSEDTPIPKEQEEEIRKFQKENGISDEELAYYVDTYPGIDANIIAAVKRGDIPEHKIMDALEEEQRERLEVLPVQARKELDTIQQKVLDIERSEEEFSDEDLARLGLSPKDIKLLRSEDPHDVNEESMKRIEAAMLKAGISKEEIEALSANSDEDEHDGIDPETGLMDDGEDERDDGEAQRGTSEADLNAFVQEMYKNNDIPDDVKENVRRAIGGDERALEKILESFSTEDLANLEAMSPGDGVGRGLMPDMDTAMKGDAPLPGLGSDYERFMSDLFKEGITPYNMGEKELLQALEAKLAQPTHAMSEDGGSVNVYNVSTKEQLARVKQHIATGGGKLKDDEEPSSKVQRPPTKAEKAKARYEELMEEEAEDPNPRRGETESMYYERILGLLDPEARRTQSKEREERGFFNYGEENQDVGEDEEFQGDDLTSAGHGELDQHREIREYARLAAWELPLLHKLAQPFETPDGKQPLRFRYTTYMGENHPAAKKVVVEFDPYDLPDLTDAQQTKMIKLVGPRYNPTKKLVKMSCESFETQAQNKRYLGDIIDKLVASAKDETGDSFKDLPTDLRHHKQKPFHTFPEQWKLTPERQKVLSEQRLRRLEVEERSKSGGKLIDGTVVIDQAMEKLSMREMFEAQQKEAIAITSKRGGAGAGAAPPRRSLGSAKRF